MPTTSQTDSQERKDWQTEKYRHVWELYCDDFVGAYFDINAIMVMPAGDRDTEFNLMKLCVEIEEEACVCVPTITRQEIRNRFFRNHGNKILCFETECGVFITDVIVILQCDIL